MWAADAAILLERSFDEILDLTIEQVELLLERKRRVAEAMAKGVKRGGVEPADESPQAMKRARRQFAAAFGGAN